MSCAIMRGYGNCISIRIILEILLQISQVVISTINKNFLIVSVASVLEKTNKLEVMFPEKLYSACMNSQKT
jgi:tetrahydromethanopterin S-methyltransferase subunit B